MFNTRWFWPALTFGIAALAFLVFGQALSFSFAPIDDYHLIVDNTTMHGWSLSSFKTIFTTFDPELYIPVTFLSFKIETLFGMNAWLFHLDNILLHIANAILVAWILIKLTASRSTAICMALIFAVHPLNTETVVWISARKDLLATFFALLSIAFALRPVLRRAQEAALSVVFFFFAALSKISVVLLPLLLIILMMRNGKTFRESIKTLSPLFVIAIILGIVAIIGKGSEIASASILDRMILSGYAISTSIGRFVWPHALSVYYTLPTINASTVFIAILPLFLLLFAWRCRERMPIVSIGLVWFFVFILPTVLNIQTDLRASGITFASDRYMYLPSIGLLIALSALAIEASKQLHRSMTQWNTAMIGITIVFLPLAYAQTQTWKDADTLFAHAIFVSPQSVQARVSVAESLKDEEKIEDAFNVLKDGLAFTDDPRLHLEAGVLYASANQVTDAEEQFNTALQLHPDFPEALYALGQLRAYEGKKAEAIGFYQQAVDLDPTFDDARNALQELK